MALSKTMKVLMAAVAVGLVILAVGLGIGLRSSSSSLQHPAEISGTSTGIRLEYSPKPTPDSLIEIKPNDQDNVKAWTDVVDKFLQDYKNRSLNWAQNVFTCGYSNQPRNGSICNVDMRGMGPCVSKNFYGYAGYEPCVFLTPNKVLNWVPVPYSTDPLPANMTADLQTYIHDWMNTYHHSMIWLNCEGESPVDQASMGSLHYYPAQGFPTYYYPYMGVDGYLSPLVAVQFKRPQTEVTINVECKIWAQNIPYDRDQQLGSVRFQLVVNH